MQVKVHLIGFPPTDEADAIAIDPGAEESYGSACVRGASGDVRGGEANVRTEEDRGSHILGDVGREEVGPLALARPDGIEGCGWGCVLRAQVLDASYQTKDGTQQEWPMVSPRTPCSCEVKVRVAKVVDNKSRRGQVCASSLRVPIQMPTSCRRKKSSQWCRGAPKYLAGAKQKVETHHQTVSGAERQSCTNFPGQANRHVDEMQPQWFDAGGGSVGLFPSVEK
jgi:hypothetical protein